MYSNSFQIEWDTIVGTVFLSILNTNGIPFGSENRKENCPHDHTPFNVKGNTSFVSVGKGAICAPFICPFGRWCIIGGHDSQRGIIWNLLISSCIHFCCGNKQPLSVIYNKYLLIKCRHISPLNLQLKTFYCI